MQLRGHELHPRLILVVVPAVALGTRLLPGSKIRHAYSVACLLVRELEVPGVRSGLPDLDLRNSCRWVEHRMASSEVLTSVPIRLRPSVVWLDSRGRPRRSPQPGSCRGRARRHSPGAPQRVAVPGSTIAVEVAHRHPGGREEARGAHHVYPRLHSLPIVSPPASTASHGLQD